MSTLESSAAAVDTPIPSATPTMDGAPLTIDPLADFPDVDSHSAQADEEGVVVRITSKSVPLDPLSATAEDLIFDLEVDGYPFFDIPQKMVNNGYYGPIFVCSSGLFLHGGLLPDTRPIYHEYDSDDSEVPVESPLARRYHVSPAWERAREIVRKHRVPDDGRMHTPGQWPLMYSANASCDIGDVWLVSCNWAKRMFLIGWALQNPHAGNTRWFVRNPDLACLRVNDWVPEKVALP